MSANVLCDGFHLWHSRLGHPSDMVLHHLPFALDPKVFNHRCYVCPMAKHTRSSFPKNTIQSKCPFEFVHVDIWGPYHLSSMTGANYFLTLVDDFTRATWTYLMTYKNQTCAVLEIFFNLVQN